MGFVESFKAGLSGEPDPDVFEAGGKVIQCPHCDGKHFEEASALLNTAGMSFLGLDWANRDAAILACKTCGYIMWFVERPAPVKFKNDRSE